MTRGDLRPVHRRGVLVGTLGAVLGVGLFVGGLVAAGAAAGRDPAPDARVGPAAGAPSTTADSTTTTAASSTTTTVAPVTTVAPSTAPAPTSAPDAPVDGTVDGTLDEGDAGPAVEALQARLTELGYWLGAPDGTYGDLTGQAVLAFQKAEALVRDGVAGPATLERLGTAQRPVATIAEGIEIDLERQLLLVVRGGAVAWALNTSTGTPATPTPTGAHVVQREIDGMRHAPLGRLYRPKYFDGGIAIHGYPRVPARPASHGCARVSYPAMDLLWAEGHAPVGSPVVVR